jgi:hypothetical protein
MLTGMFIVTEAEAAAIRVLTGRVENRPPRWSWS